LTPSHTFKRKQNGVAKHTHNARASDFEGSKITDTAIFLAAMSHHHHHHHHARQHEESFVEFVSGDITTQVNALQAHPLGFLIENGKSGLDRGVRADRFAVLVPYCLTQLRCQSSLLSFTLYPKIHFFDHTISLSLFYSFA
jgi:hypothetical protein